MKFVSFLCILIFSLSTLAERVEINKIAMSVGGESWTARDQQIYESVLTELFKKKKISNFSTDAQSDFILSRVCNEEAKNFKLTSEKIVLNEATKKKLAAFSAAEIDREIDAIAGAMAVIELKEAQHKDQLRFNNWFELMKRKYAVKLK